MTYFGTRLSENLSRRNPEGYLICLNVPVARTGTQEYLPQELGLPPGGGPVPVFRPEEEVFSPACRASFEGMPVTDDHPSFPEGVTAENIRWLQKGHAHNVRRGSGPESDLLLADLIITDPGLIDQILAGKREISCGYNYTLCREDGRYVQREIRGNHIAVVDAGRAGPRVSIRDHGNTQDQERRNPMKQTRSTHSRVPRSRLYARRTARLMAHMARDGETEELAEMIAELMEPDLPEATASDPAEEIAEAVEEILQEAPAGAAPVAVAVPENREIRIDEEESRAHRGAELSRTAHEMEQIVSLLQQILALLQPAADCGDPAKDEDPADETAETLAEAVVEAVTNPEPGADPLEALVSGAVEEAVREDPDEAVSLVAGVLESIQNPDPVSETLEPDQENRDRTADALRAALKTFRPVLKAMPPAAQRRAVGRIAAELKARDRSQKAAVTPSPYAALMNAARVRDHDADLGRRIMEKRNANLRKAR